MEFKYIFFLKHLSGPESWILEFDWANQALVKDKLLKQKSKQVKFYNQNTKEPPPLQTGEVVRVAPKPVDWE